MIILLTRDSVLGSNILYQISYFFRQKQLVSFLRFHQVCYISKFGIFNTLKWPEAISLDHEYIVFAKTMFSRWKLEYEKSGGICTMRSYNFVSLEGIIRQEQFFRRCEHNLPADFSSASCQGKTLFFQGLKMSLLASRPVTRILCTASCKLTF
jgi:hypothetical protein